jgi:disulfide bond formation protein DsbB
MYEFKNDNNNDHPAPTLADLGTDMMSIIVRLFGFALLLAGLWIAIFVMLEAMELYENPKKIETLAAYIEQGSNVDKSLVSLRDSVTEEAASDEIRTQIPQGTIRVSYFFAWVIAILMLMLIARISLTAIKTGGELVLYDVHIKRFARQLARESMKAPE